MSKNENRPVGQRFDYTYLKPGDPLSDSQRMRRRLAALFSEVSDHLRGSTPFASILERELGVHIETYAMSGGVDSRAFFLKAELRDILTAITIVWRALPDYRRKSWRRGVERIFYGENTIYLIDEEAGVHPSPDVECERNRVATIAALAPARYRAALAEFEKVQEALNEQPQDLTEGIFRTFKATEIVFKLMCPNPDRLSGDQIEQKLTPIIQAKYSDDDTAKKAALKICEGFKDWVNGAHWYRHGQPDEEPRQPPPELAIMIMSSGAAHLRWLAQIDQSRTQ